MTVHLRSMDNLPKDKRPPGRPKGAVSTWKKDLQAIADAAGYDPAICLMHMAADPKTPLKYRYLCHKTIFDRMYPYRHVVGGDPNSPPVALNITWNDGEEPEIIDGQPIQDLPDLLVDGPEGLEDDTKPSEE